MLVLSRKKNETIVIDGAIEISIRQVKGGTVKVGITAPRSVQVLRGELDDHRKDSVLDGSPAGADIRTVEAPAFLQKAS